MATVDINNTQPARLENGGSLILDDGSNSYVIHLRDPGDVSIEPGGYALLEYRDAGAVQIPIMGDQRYTVLRFKAKVTNELATASKLLYWSTQYNTGAGKAKVFTVTVKIPDYLNAATGDTMAYANCYFTAPGKYQEGQEFDMLEFEMRSTTITPTLATY